MSVSALLWTGLIMEEQLHRQRFHEYMESNMIEYSDSNCEYGWRETSLFRMNKAESQWNYIMTMEWDD